MFTILIIIVWIASCLFMLKAGFYLGKYAPHNRSLRGEIGRRFRILNAYVKAFIGVLIPAYGRRQKRKRAEAAQAFRDNLVTIERAPWTADIYDRE